VAVLIDSNVLLRSLHPGHPHYADAGNSVAALRLRNEDLCIAPQTLIEFWAVATRPRDDNGLGLSPHRVAAELTSLRRLFRLLPSNPDVFETWQRIVTTHGVLGKQTHDAHLVAIMQVHAVTSILTFNVSHFVRFPGISVLNPANI
jgi:predicted nucleic acid-binding protein